MTIYQSVLVTGASSGMGKVFAERLLKEGKTVFAAARSTEKMQDLADAGAVVIGMDITNDDDILAAVKEIRENGGVDVLINNAGYGQYGSVEDTSIDAARYQFGVNLFGLARLTQLLIPSMREKKKGLIINISSVGGRIYTPLGAWYHATKHALEGWSDCLRLELKAHGIDVVVVRPGIIKSGFGTALEQHFETGESGAYDTLSEALKAGIERSYGVDKPNMRPSVVADAIAHAVSARRPKTRYVAGAMAKPLLVLRWLLPDRLFDRLIMSQVK